MKKISSTIIRHPVIVLMGVLVLTVLSILAIKQNLRMETDLDEYMPKSHPAFVYSDEAEALFNIKDGIIIAMENKEGIYNSGTLQKIKDLTEELEDLEQIEKDDVTSLYTADNILGTELGLDIKPFYKKVPKSENKLNELKDHVRTNDMVYKRLVSEDETVTVVIAKIGDDVFSEEFYHKILDIAKKYEGPEILHVAGQPIVEGTMATLMPKDMKKMVPIVLLLIVIVLLLVLRSPRATLLTMAVVVISTIWAFGIMSAFSIPVYAPATMIPVMLIAIGVADGIHLFSHLHLYRLNNPGHNKPEAIQNMFSEMWKPVVMTSVTTGIGFFSLITSQVYPIKYFAIFTAFGVMAAMVLSLALIPAGLQLIGLPKIKAKEPTSSNNSGSRTSQMAYKFAELVVRRKYITLGITVAIVLITAFGINKVWINSSFLEKFERDSEIVQTDAFVNQHFGGTTMLNIVLEADSADAFKNPQTLALADAMQQQTDKQLEVVGSTFGLADFLKRMNKVMHEDDENYNRLPEDKNLIAQYILLYEMSGDPDKLWEVVDYDFQQANINFQLKSDNSKAINEVLAEVEQFRDDFRKQGIEINYAGSGYKGLVFTDLILEGQISSLLLSLVVVVILLSIMFRNFYLGLIGSIPIVITTVISFGVLGWLDIPLSTTTALISSIAIGIGIDYAVHFIDRYRIYAKQSGDKQYTVTHTMAHTGRAIVFNAAVVIAGFLILLFSVFPPNRMLGFMVSLNMFTSFLGTITVMYIALYLSNIYFKNKSDSQTVDKEMAADSRDNISLTKQKIEL